MSELDEAIKPPEFKEQDEMFSDLDWHLYHADCGCIGTRDKKSERDRLKTIQTLFNFYREAAQRTADLEGALQWALTYGTFEVAEDNPMQAAAYDRARAALTPPPTERGEG
jgi:hypothetical protein